MSRMTAMSAYHRLLDEHIGKRSVLEVARAWSIPQWVLYDGLRERSAAPSAKHLPAVAAGLDMTERELLQRLGLTPVPVVEVTP